MTTIAAGVIKNAPASLMIKLVGQLYGALEYVETIELPLQSCMYHFTNVYYQDRCGRSCGKSPA